MHLAAAMRRSLEMPRLKYEEAQMSRRRRENPANTFNQVISNLTALSRCTVTDGEEEEEEVELLGMIDV